MVIYNFAYNIYLLIDTLTVPSSRTFTDSANLCMIDIIEGKIIYPWTIGSKTASILTSINSPLDAAKSTYRFSFRRMTIEIYIIKLFKMKARQHS